MTIKFIIFYIIAFCVAPRLVAMEGDNFNKRIAYPSTQQSSVVNTTKLRKADTFIKHQLLDKLVDFSTTDPKKLFNPMDAFVGMNMKNRKDYCTTAQVLKGLAKTLLPMFKRDLLSEEACAHSFFTYLNQHPELSKFHADYVQTLRNCALNYYTGEIAYGISHALFFAAEDWITSNIKKLKTDTCSTWLYSKQRTNNIKPVLEKHCPGKLDACYDLLSKIVGVSVID